MLLSLVEFFKQFVFKLRLTLCELLLYLFLLNGHEVRRHVKHKLASIVMHTKTFKQQEQVKKVVTDDASAKREEGFANIDVDVLCETVPEVPCIYHIVKDFLDIVRDQALGAFSLDDLGDLEVFLELFKVESERLLFEVIHF